MLLLASEARLAELAGVLDEGKATNQSAVHHPLDRLEVQVTQAAMPLPGLAVMTQRQTRGRYMGSYPICTGDLTRGVPLPGAFGVDLRSTAYIKKNRCSIRARPAAPGSPHCSSDVG